MSNVIALTALALALALSQPPSQAGSVVESVVHSRVYRRDRRVWVYTPPRYPASCAPSGCSVVVTFDGGVYTGDIPLPAILDSLITANRIPPTVALMIDNASGSARLADLANQPTFVRFVGDELVPWFRDHYTVTTDSRRAVITGSSAGGLAAAYLALERPDLFGNVFSQSGAFWRGPAGSNTGPFEWLTTQFASAPRKPVRFMLDVGSTESTGAINGTAPSILAANRRLRDTLEARGYSVEYFEVPGGVHAPSTWKLRLPAALVALAPRSKT